MELKFSVNVNVSVMKLNVLLAVTDSLRGKYKRMVEDFTKFFKGSQGAFLGEKSTYVPKEGMVDDPSKRRYSKVVTTVDEKLDWFLNESKEFIDSLFSVEKTNALGLASAELVVDGKSWGIFSSLELLRLKSLLESGDMGSFENMISEIPVRADSVIWNKTTAEEYQGREIFETPLVSGSTKTTVKEEYILEDPNLVRLGSQVSYSPKTSVRTTVVDTGDYTNQNFSGQWSHRQRAGVLKRRGDLLTAIIAALKECNNCEVVKSDLTANKIFDYLFYNK